MFKLACSSCHPSPTEESGLELLKAEFPSKPPRDKCECDAEKDVDARRCMKCFRKSTEKISWPTTEKLLEMVEQSSYLAVGRELGVSDNAVRKRIKYHPAETKC